MCGSWRCRLKRPGFGELSQEFGSRLLQRQSRIAGIDEGLFQCIRLGNQLRVKWRGDNVAPFLRRLECKNELAVADSKGSLFHGVRLVMAFCSLPEAGLTATN